MPKVPQAQRQVGEASLPQLRSADLTGTTPLDGRFGQAVSQFGEAVSGFVQKQQKQAAEVNKAKSRSYFTGLENDTLYHPEFGALNTKGENSFNLHETSLVEFDEQAQKYIQSLPQAYQGQAQVEYMLSRQNVDKAINRHMSRERLTVDEQIHESYMKNEREAISKNFYDPERVNMGIKRMREEIQNFGDRMGQPSELIKERLQGEESKVRFSILGNMLNGGLEKEGKEYFEAYKDRFTSEDLESAKELIDEAYIRGESQRRADQIWDQQAGSLGGSLDKARDISDAKLRDETMRRIRQKNSDFNSAKKAERMANYDMAAEFVKKNPTADARDVIPASIWNKLTLKQQRDLDKFVDNPTNNDKKWLDFLDLSRAKIAGMTRQEFEQDYWQHFDSSHRTRAEKMWKESKTPAAARTSLTSVMSAKQQVENTLRNSGLIAENKSISQLSKEQRKIYTRMLDAAQDNIEQNELEKGRKLTPTERQDVIDNIMLQTVFVDNFFSDEEVAAIAVKENDLDDVYVPYNKIDPDMRKRIEADLRKRGIDYDRELVERIAGSAMAGDDERINKLIEDAR